jgi:hypothetical protein
MLWLIRKKMTYPGITASDDTDFACHIRNLIECEMLSHTVQCVKEDDLPGR